MKKFQNTNNDKKNSQNNTVKTQILQNEITKNQNFQNDKTKIRNQILQKRNNLSLQFVSKKSDLIIKKLEKYIEYYNDIMIFIDMKNEVQITKLIKLYPNKNFYIPKTFSNGDMKINKYNENELILHKFGYLESTSTHYINKKILDCIIVPGVAFDKEKNRIGFGKGYYDRFLKDFINCKNLDFEKNNNENYKIIAVCYDFQIIDFIPSENHDIKPEIIITENNIIY